MQTSSVQLLSLDPVKCTAFPFGTLVYDCEYIYIKFLIMKTTKIETDIIYFTKTIISLKYKSSNSLCINRKFSKFDIYLHTNYNFFPFHLEWYIILVNYNNVHCTCKIEIKNSMYIAL